MEAVKEEKFEDCLTGAFAQLQWENDRLINAEEAVHTMVEAMVNFFIENSDQDRDSCNCIDQIFSPIGSRFSDRNEYIDFLSRLETQLSKKKNLLEENEYHRLRHEIFLALENCIYYLLILRRKTELAPVEALEKEAAAIDHTLPLEQRYESAQKLKSDIISLAATGVLPGMGTCGNKEVLDSDHIRTLTGRDILRFLFSDRNDVPAALDKVVEIIQAIEEEKKFIDTFGYIDKEALRKNCLEFGAKGANMLAAQDFLSKFQGTHYDNIVKNISIPRFELISIALYKKWKNGEDISESLMDVYELFKGKAMMVRSSAVYSEDGENMTGAGIYVSVPLKEDATFDEFKTAVEKVYKSCDSKKAGKYRREHGIETEERMGIVVQEKSEYPDPGYVNSTRPRTNDIIDIKFDYPRAPFSFDVSELDRCIFVREPEKIFSRASRVEPDFSDMHGYGYYITDIAVFARLLEKHYGQPVQMEFSEEAGPLCESRFDCLQVRPLPAKMFKIPDIQLPNDMPFLYECSCEGVCDEVLEILDVNKNNNEKKGLVIFASNWEGSQKIKQLERAMPKEGAVMILSVTVSGGGHIETLASERGVTLLFHNRKDFWKDRKDEIADSVRTAVQEANSLL